MLRKWVFPVIYVEFVNTNHPVNVIIISGIDEAEEFDIGWPSAGFIDQTRQLQQQYNVDYIFAMIEKPLQVPPWRILQVKYCEHLL